VLAETRQAVILADDPTAESVPEPSLRPQKQDERESAPESFRRILRGLLVRDVQVWRDRGGGRV